MDQTQGPLKSCPRCAFQMPETASFCPGCGRRMEVAAAAESSEGTSSEHIAGALAYLTFLPAIALLLLMPYKRSRFVRFHALQCLLAWGAGVVLAIALKYLGQAVFLIPVLGPLLVLIAGVIALLAAIFIWLVLVVKALQGETLKLPLLGSYAEQFASTAMQTPAP